MSYANSDSQSENMDDDEEMGGSDDDGDDSFTSGYEDSEGDDEEDMMMAVLTARNNVQAGVAERGGLESFLVVAQSHGQAFLNAATSTLVDATVENAMAAATAASGPALAPLQQFDDFVARVRENKTLVLKITDACVKSYGLDVAHGNAVAAAARLQGAREAVDVPADIESLLRLHQQQFQGHPPMGVNDALGMDVEEEAQEPSLDAMIDDLLEAIASSKGFTHIILGHGILRILQSIPNSQRRLLASALTAGGAAPNLTYIKLGTDNEVDPSAVETAVVLESLLSHSTPKLSEIEIRGLILAEKSHIIQMGEILSSRKATLRQINLLGINVEKTTSNDRKISNVCSPSTNGSIATPPASLCLSSETGFLDPLVNAVVGSPALDELKLSSLAGAVPSLLTSSALKRLLDSKNKWWRLALEGAGLTNEHCQVIRDVFSSDDAAKVGDLLSLTGNPSISDAGYKMLAATFFRKSRMGLIRVDDASWNARFDLVRSMNNLHSRLDYLDPLSGSFSTQAMFIEWLARINSISWQDDQHRLNYIWFTLIERPDFIKMA
jgi:hypothetical protein